MARILITGGTGSLGQAMTRYLIETTQHEVVILSRDELKQYNMLQTFGHTDRNRIRMFIGDVRDLMRLRRAFLGVDVVIHAAALKRIEVAHYNPNEMVKTNVIGSMNVVEAAQDCRVKKVIGLSTDKAFQPISAYGHSKAMMECIILAANNTSGAGGPEFLVSRYGNVSGSNGSVIPIWRQTIELGAMITISNPDVTRFWMTIQQAVELVWSMAVRTQSSNLVIPHLRAYRLGDLALAMDQDQETWKVTGLPDWEKMHESMDANQCSETADRMTVDELREALKSV